MHQKIKDITQTTHTYNIEKLCTAHPMNQISNILSSSQIIKDLNSVVAGVSYVELSTLCTK